MKVIALLCALLVHHATGSSSYGNSPVSRASNEFTMRLFRELSQRSRNSDNLVVSGLSAHAALTMLHQGAAGSTAQQLAKVLRLSSASSNINEAYKSMLDDMQNDDNINMVNNLYPSSNYQLNGNFANQAKQYFQANVKNLDYNNPSQAAQQINNDVERETNNKIRNLVGSGDLSGSTALVIVNALHFKAPWEKQFAGSRQQEFHVSPSQKVQAEMMHQTSQFEYKDDHGLDAKILKMNYDQEEAEDYSMMLILPNSKNGLSSMESKLAQANPENLMQGLKKTRVEVTIPKFEVKKSIEMKDTLQRMGASEMFSSAANFHKMVQGQGVHVSNVFQKAIVTVDENGTEAAAATFVGVQPYSAHMPMPASAQFKADHPFMFTIMRQGTIMFAGKIGNPSSN